MSDNTDDLDTADDLIRVFALLPEQDWQAEYAGLYGGLMAPELAVKLYALRLLIDREFEAADAAVFEAESGHRLPPVPEAERQARIERLRKEIAQIQARAEARRLPAGEGGS